MQFKKKQAKFWALLDIGSEINFMTLAYIAKLSLKIQLINIKAQKINNSIFETFGIILTSFEIKKKPKKAQFF